MCQKLWAKATERVGVFEHVKISQNLEHFQKSMISEAVKNAFIFCVLKQAGYIREHF